MTDSKVSLLVGGGSPYELDPGCTISWNFTKDLTTFATPGGMMIYNNAGLLVNNTIRIDTRVAATSVATEHYPQTIDFNALINELKSQTATSLPDVLYWSCWDFEGRVKSVTVTQRPGEGDLYDLSIIFEVGKVTATATV